MEQSNRKTFKLTEKEINKAFEKVLDKLKTKSKYAEVCKLQSDLDNCKSLTKLQANELKSKHQINLKVAGKDKMFYQDYKVGEIRLRLMIPYGHGMVDSSYRVFEGMTDNSFPTFSFRQFAEHNKLKENDYVFTFPTNINVEEYESTLLFILEMNDEILSILKSELEKSNEQ